MAWNSVCPEFPPVACLLRSRPNWARIHTLPEAKRYPDCSEEFETILHRHNSILSFLCQSDPNVFLITAEYTNTFDPETNKRRQSTWLSNLDRDYAFWRCIPEYEALDDPDNDIYDWLYTSKWVWKNGVFDNILRLVAEDKIAGLIILGANNPWAYHPYDGGGDIVAETSGSISELRNIYPEWFSTCKDGL